MAYAIHCRHIFIFVSLSVLFVANAIRLPNAGASSICKDSRAVTGSVLLEQGEYKYVPGPHEDAVAKGVYVDSSKTVSNFGKLEIKTSEAYLDNEQMFGAGFIEGYLTAERIYDNFHNIKAYFLNQLNASLDEPMKWLARQDAWLRGRVKAEAEHDPYWRAIGLVHTQFEGLVAGYHARAADAVVKGQQSAVPHLTREDFVFLNNNGDLYDVIDALDAGFSKRYSNMSGGELFLDLATKGKCSALIKLAADLSDIYIGHSTWDSYTAALRIYKMYNFQLRDENMIGEQMSFSSYPGELLSDDDFYLLATGIIIVETTNHIFDPAVYRPLTSSTVPSWQRSRAASLLAHDGKSWISLFSKYNSGTYNNQYMVLDLHKFKPYKVLLPGLLHVVEQLPGLIKVEDVTETLLRGYWPSYNVAYFPEIYNMSGYPKFVEEQVRRGHEYEMPAKWLNYQVAPRASLFRREQGSISSLDDMKRVMRSNKWKSDPLSGGHPVAAICGRGDLAPSTAFPAPIPKGCYDSKVTSASLASSLEAEVVNGPSRDGDMMPFSWDDWTGFEHRGHPRHFDFEFERMKSTIASDDCQKRDA